MFGKLGYSVVMFGKVRIHNSYLLYGWVGLGLVW